MIPRQPRSTLFPYTTLFRSACQLTRVWARVGKYIHETMMAERSEEHTSELQSHVNLVCRLLLEKKKIDLGELLAQKAKQLLDIGDLLIVRRRLCLLWHAHGRETEHFDQRRQLGLAFFFNDTATTEIYTLSLHDALPIWKSCQARFCVPSGVCHRNARSTFSRSEEHTSELQSHVNLVCRLLLEKKKE